MTDHTADTSFEPFGKCYPSPADPEKDGLSVRECTASSRKAASLSVFPCEVRIECPPGTARLLVASSPELTDFRTFPLRNHVRLRPGVPFCVIPLYTPLAWRMLIRGTPCASRKSGNSPPPTPGSLCPSRFMSAGSWTAGSRRTLQNAGSSGRRDGYMNSSTSTKDR